MGAPVIDPMKFIIRTNDMIKFTFPPPIIIPAILAPVPLIGTSINLLVASQMACLQGDELPPVLRTPLAYTNPPALIPGTGILTVTLLPPNLSKLTNKGGKPILLKGMQFPALFTITSPAMQSPPIPPKPDSDLSPRQGFAEFITTNATVMAG